MFKGNSGSSSKPKPGSDTLSMKDICFNWKPPGSFGSGQLSKHLLPTQIDNRKKGMTCILYMYVHVYVHMYIMCSGISISIYHAPPVVQENSTFSLIIYLVLTWQSARSSQDPACLAPDTLSAIPWLFSHTWPWSKTVGDHRFLGTCSF